MHKAVRTFGVPDPCNEVPFGQLAQVLVHTSVSEPGNLNDECGWHDFVIFGAHLDLARPAINRRLRIHKTARNSYGSQDAELL